MLAASLSSEPDVVLIAERDVRRRRRHQRQRGLEVAVEAAVALGAMDEEARVAARQLLDGGPALEARAVVVDDAGPVAARLRADRRQLPLEQRRIGVVGGEADRDRRVDGDGRAAAGDERDRLIDEQPLPSR